MKKPTRTPEELSSIINGFRMKYQNDAFTSSELASNLVILGFSKNIAYRIMKSFPSKKVGCSTIYQLPKEHINVDLIANCIKEEQKFMRDYNKRNYSSKKNKEIDVNSALKAVRAAGYQIRKIVGFDMEKFSKENPEMYKKYLKYEII
jgi:hypothetical protein